jgi:hypothetical protein
MHFAAKIRRSNTKTYPWSQGPPKSKHHEVESLGCTGWTIILPPSKQKVSLTNSEDILMHTEKRGNKAVRYSVVINDTDK